MDFGDVDRDCGFGVLLSYISSYTGLIIKTPRGSANLFEIENFIEKVNLSLEIKIN